jgi:CBS domain-containing protein
MAKNLSDYTVSATDPIRTAMEKITRNRHRAVIVMDAGKVVGTVSDGDIRRAFLEDVLPIAPVEKIMNLNCIVTTERDPAKLAAIIGERKVTILPIVDDSYGLVDVYLSYEPFMEEGVPRPAP